MARRRRLEQDLGKVLLIMTVFIMAPFFAKSAGLTNLDERSWGVPMKLLLGAGSALAATAGWLVVRWRCRARAARPDPPS